MNKLKLKIQNGFKKLIRWALSSEIATLEKQIKENDLQYRRIQNLLGNLDISVDKHYYSPSWAVISIQGWKTDFIKFIDLGRSDIMEIQKFLHRYDRSKVDAAPQESRFLKIPRHKHEF